MAEQVITPDPARYSREHNMKTQDVGRGKTVYPKHELINEAHNRGMTSIELFPVSSQGEDEYVFIAKVCFADGTVFTDVGDANPQNCNSTTATALARMAATRAISRAVALGINADSNVDVEMPQGGGNSGGGGQRQSRSSSRQRNGDSGYQRSNSKYDDEEE